MENDPFSYIARLEIMAFFAGYPLVYSLIIFLAAEARGRGGLLFSRLAGLLPLSYAVSGLLFLGFMAKKAYVGHTLGVPATQIFHPYLVVWGLLALIFWIPVFRRVAILSLLHSLFFFSFIPFDIYRQWSGSVGKEVVGNDMNILTNSFILQACILLAVRAALYIWSKARIRIK